MLAFLAAQHTSMCILCLYIQQSSYGSVHKAMGRSDSSIKEKLSILETIVKDSVVKRDHSNDDDNDEVNDSVLHLVYKRDGITDLEFITLIAQNAEIAGVSISEY